MMREKDAPGAQWEHHMKKKSGSDMRTDDLHLFALLVAKRLRHEHQLESAPAPGDYRIADSKVFSQIGKEVQVEVDLGRGLKVMVYDAWWQEDEAGLDFLIRCANGTADKISETVGQAEGTRQMIAEVRGAARKEVAKARRRGLAYTMMSVSLPPLQAGGHDQTVARVQHLALGRSLQLEPFAFHAECAEDVVSAFARLADEQSRRSASRAWLDHKGATGTIDSVVVAALAAAGLDLPHVLTTMRDADEWIVDFDGGDGERLTLFWEEGAVRARIKLGEEVMWHKGKLCFGKSARSLKRLPSGSPVSRLFEHPFLEERIRIDGSYETEGEHLSVYCKGEMLNFDADSGRLWTA